MFYPVAKLVPVGYGIKKLQIGCVVEDDKVLSHFKVVVFLVCSVLSPCLPLLPVHLPVNLFFQVGTDILEETITAFEDYVQSMDVAAFNKI